MIILSKILFFNEKIKELVKKSVGKGRKSLKTLSKHCPLKITLVGSKAYANLHFVFTFQEKKKRKKSPLSKTAAWID